MTTPDPLAAARERIAEWRALLAAGTPGPWRRHPDRWAPPQWEEDMAYLRVEAGEPHPASGLGVRIFHTDGAREGDVEDQRHEADVALTVTAVNAFAAAIDHAESVLERHYPLTGMSRATLGYAGYCCHDEEYDERVPPPWPCPDARPALTFLGVE